MARWLTWMPEGWACSQCAWTFFAPALLSDPEAKTAYDRLAKAKFQDHDCAEHAPRSGLATEETFSDRARKLITRGFKPKDAVEITLQEIELEHRHDGRMLEQARRDAEDFLRRVKAGSI